MLSRITRILFAVALLAGVASAGVKLRDGDYHMTGVANGTIYVTNDGNTVMSDTTEGGTDHWVWNAATGQYDITDGDGGGPLGTLEFQSKRVGYSGWFEPDTGAPLPAGPRPSFQRGAVQASRSS